MLLDTLRASLLWKILTGKGILRACYKNEKGKGMIRVGYGNKMHF